MTGKTDSIPDQSTIEAWSAALEATDVDLWLDYLEKIEVSDQLAFIQTQGAFCLNGLLSSLAEWLHFAWQCSEYDLFHLISDTRLPFKERLGWATFVRWRNLLEQVLLEPAVEEIPQSGVALYFGDNLSFQALVEYRRTGTTVDLTQVLVVPDPRAYADPIFALQHVSTDSQLDLLRRSLASRHKILIHRNTLIYIDREASTDVFGPTIDTLLLNDWLFENRYRTERTPENAWLFEDPLAKRATQQSFLEGSTFLEIGCGNGLLTATFAKNEAKVQRFTAIDRSMNAINTTYYNSARQRMLHRGCIGDRGIYITAKYEVQLMSQPSDLVVCNPPYTPLPDNSDDSWKRETLGIATIGTDLLVEVVRDSPALVSHEGSMVLVCSELAKPELFGALPNGWTAEPARSMVVPFRVQAAQGRGRDEYLEWLVQGRGLKRKKENNGTYYTHTVTIYNIKPLNSRVAR